MSHRGIVTIAAVVALLPVPLAAPAIAQTAGAQTGDDSEPSVRLLLTAQDRYPAWSPDGDVVVFSSDRTGTFQIFLVDPEEGVPVQITDFDGYKSGPVFSPDGEWIAFAMNRDDASAVYVMRTDGTGVRNVSHSGGWSDEAGGPMDGSHPKWAPDGRSIVFNGNVEEGNAEVFEISIDGSDLRRLTDFPDHDTYPSISPDGRHLLWRRITPHGGDSESGRNSEIFIADRDGGDPRNLTNPPAFDGYPVWLPSGDGVVFASNRDGEAFHEFNLYVMRPDGSGVTRLTDPVPGVLQARPSVSADGRAIVFNRDFFYDEPHETNWLFIQRFERPIRELIVGAGSPD